MQRYLTQNVLRLLQTMGVLTFALARRMSFPLERSLLCLEMLAIWERRADLSLTATLTGGGRGGRGVCVFVTS